MGEGEIDTIDQSNSVSSKPNKDNSTPLDATVETEVTNEDSSTPLDDTVETEVTDEDSSTTFYDTIEAEVMNTNEKTIMFFLSVLIAMCIFGTCIGAICIVICLRCCRRSEKLRQKKATKMRKFSIDEMSKSVGSPQSNAKAYATNQIESVLNNTDDFEIEEHGDKFDTSKDEVQFDNFMTTQDLELANYRLAK